MINKPEYFLSNYLNVITEFEKTIISNYDLKNIPYNEQGKFPGSGNLIVKGKEIQYSYHGNGCTLKYENIEVTYNIYADRDNYIATGPYEFMNFINSFRPDNLIGKTEVIKYLNKLEQHGILKKIYKEFLVYEIDLNWYKASKYQFENKSFDFE